MAEVVEGEWKDFTFKMAIPQDYPDIFEHLHNNFYQDEPINRHLGQGEQKTKDMDKVAFIYLEEGISFIAIHKLTGKIAGVRVMGIAKKGDDNMEELFNMLESQELKDAMPIIVELITSANLHEKLGVEVYGDFLFVSVDKEFRGQGLATEMYKRAIKLLQSRGIPACSSIFTNPHSYKIAQKLGFVEFGRKYFRDYRTQDGRQLMPNCTEDEVGILMAKKF